MKNRKHLCRRIIPPTVSNEEIDIGIDVEGLTETNKLMHLWFYGKVLIIAYIFVTSFCFIKNCLLQCRLDHSWCWTVQLLPNVSSDLQHLVTDEYHRINWHHDKRFFKCKYKLYFQIAKAHIKNIKNVVRFILDNQFARRCVSLVRHTDFTEIENENEQSKLRLFH